MSRRQDAAFARGDIGVDGEATEETREAAEVERARAREQFLAGKTWLGREFLTWLLWRSESSDALLEFHGEPVHVLFGGRLTLKGVTGDVIELTVKGTEAAYSKVNRFALEHGLLIHAAKIKLTLGEKEFDFTLDAQLLDIRSAKLPDLLTDDEDDRIQERLFLSERLGDLVQTVFIHFLELRRTPEWKNTIVPEILDWLRADK